MNEIVQDHTTKQELPSIAAQHISVERVEYSDYFSQYPESFESSGDGDQGD